MQSPPSTSEGAEAAWAYLFLLFVTCLAFEKLERDMAPTPTLQRILGLPVDAFAVLGFSLVTLMTVMDAVNQRQLRGETFHPLLIRFLRALGILLALVIVAGMIRSIAMIGINIYARLVKAPDPGRLPEL